MNERYRLSVDEPYAANKDGLSCCERSANFSIPRSGLTRTFSAQPEQALQCRAPRYFPPWTEIFLR